MAIVMACGVQKPTSRSVELASVDAGAKPASAKTKLGIPRDAVLVGALDPVLFTEIDAAREWIEQALDLPDKSLLGHPERIGLSPSEPIVVTFAPASAAQEKLIAELRALSTTEKPSPGTWKIPAGLTGRRDLASTLRILLPGVDIDRTRAVLTALLGRVGWKAEGPSMTRAGESLSLRDDGVSLAIDSGRADALADAEEEPPALEKRALSARWSPRPLADVMFASEISVAAMAMSKTDVDPEQRDGSRRRSSTTQDASFLSQRSTRSMSSCASRRCLSSCGRNRGRKPHSTLRGSHPRSRSCSRGRTTRSRPPEPSRPAGSFLEPHRWGHSTWSSARRSAHASSGCRTSSREGRTSRHTFSRWRPG
jgi:hypothetical protein